MHACILTCTHIHTCAPETKTMKVKKLRKSPKWYQRQNQNQIWYKKLSGQPCSGLWHSQTWLKCKWGYHRVAGLSSWSILHLSSNYYDHFLSLWLTYLLLPHPPPPPSPPKKEVYRWPPPPTTILLKSAPASPNSARLRKSPCLLSLLPHTHNFSESSFYAHKLLPSPSDPFIQPAFDIYTMRLQETTFPTSLFVLSFSICLTPCLPNRGQPGNSKWGTIFEAQYYGVEGRGRALFTFQLRLRANKLFCLFGWFSWIKTRELLLVAEVVAVTPDNTSLVPGTQKVQSTPASCLNSTHGLWHVFAGTHKHRILIK